MKITNEAEFIDLLMKTEATRIYLETETPVYMNKKDNPLIKCNVTKRCKGVYIFNRNYADLVNEAIAAGKKTARLFNPKNRVWGKWVEGAEEKLLEHTDKMGDHHYYLSYYTHDVREGVGPVYFVNGVEATPEQVKTIEEFTLHRATPKRQLEAGIEEKQAIKTSTVRFDNILEYEFRFDIDESAGK